MYTRRQKSKTRNTLKEKPDGESEQKRETTDPYLENSRHPISASRTKTKRDKKIYSTSLRPLQKESPDSGTYRDETKPLDGEGSILIKRRTGVGKENQRIIVSRRFSDAATRLQKDARCSCGTM